MTYLCCVDLTLLLLSTGDEDQLTADVTTLATWGDSETTSDPSDSDESADSDDSENTPADEREIDEQDDGECVYLLLCSLL